MSMSDNLVEALKTQMRSKRITYKDAAKALGLSEASIKRLFSDKNLSLQRLEKLCELTQISFSELVASAEQRIETTDELSIEQEQAIVDNPKLLLVGVCLVNHYTFEDILGKYSFEEPELISLFAQLDKLNIIELLPGNRYRLKLSPDFRWQPSGPIQSFFIESLVKEYMIGEMKSSENHMHFVWGMISEDAANEFIYKVKRLVDDYVQLTNSRTVAPIDRHNSSLLVIFKENWEPSVFKAQWQEKHGLKQPR